ncbi:hypothetical protein JDM601_3910 [Mycolicibacter sinensis]|uniref:Uncharacterized protein n=1 Tax=Mycolicibacter sinensis (strain JDM601) TaxID=875328 RepID=F5YSB2_MYCSD|nr:hypothetical protein JDM601_3910 [Mycolicibacter sinensis]
MPPPSGVHVPPCLSGPIVPEGRGGGMTPAALDCAACNST